MSWCILIQSRHQSDNSQASGGGAYGQNLQGLHLTADAGDGALDLYNREIKCYPESTCGVDEDAYPVSPCNPSADPIEMYGRFTQVVWVDSVSVGCAIYVCGEIDSEVQVFPLTQTGEVLRSGFTSKTSSELSRLLA